MKTGKIVWGMFLIFLGSVFLLDNLDIINFYWGSVWRFWPVVFILIGMNMLLSRLENKNLVALLVALITFLVLGLVGYKGLQPSENSWTIINNDDNDNDSLAYNEANFIEPYQGSERVELNIFGAAASFRLSDSTTNLFEAAVNQRFGKYTLQKNNSDSLEVLNFKMLDGKKNIHLDDWDDNKSIIRLNLSPIWDINLKMGAGEGIFDLTPYKVRSLKFEGGAASLEAKIGDKQPLTNVSVEAGLASVKIIVPSESGCKIDVDSGLSSKDFIGFNKMSDGSYETSNYSTAKNKVNIQLEGGLSSFEVIRY
jgi:hypothetical protein